MKETVSNLKKSSLYRELLLLYKYDLFQVSLHYLALPSKTGGLLLLILYQNSTCNKLKKLYFHKTTSLNQMLVWCCFKENFMKN